MSGMIAIIGTLDTKGDQVEYLKTVIEENGHKTCVIDVGIVGKPLITPDVSHEQVAVACGSNLGEIVALNDPNAAMVKMAEGGSEILNDLLSRRELDGVVALGGSMGTALSLQVIKVLPVGVPKLIITTVAHSAAITPDMVGGQDLMIIPWVAGLWGLNSLAKKSLETAAGAISGAVETCKRKVRLTRKVVGVTSLGGTVSTYMNQLKPALEDRGYEVAVFHMTGMSGRVFEKAIADGLIEASLDLSAGVELVNQVAGGVCTSGEHRLEAAGKRGIPQIVSPGALEAFHWGKDRPFPAKYNDRPRHQHNELLLVVTSSVSEIAAVGQLMAKKLNMSTGPTAVVIPMGGIGELPAPKRDVKMSEAHQSRVAFRKALSCLTPDGLKAFHKALVKNIKPEIKVITLDAGINDPPYTQTILELFDEMMRK
jgi:uncharacterized protein (UPF0261 family)